MVRIDADRARGREQMRRYRNGPNAAVIKEKRRAYERLPYVRERRRAWDAAYYKAHAASLKLYYARRYIAMKAKRCARA